MNAEFSLIWQNLQELINTFFALLPNMTLALTVFLIFFFVARTIKRNYPLAQPKRTH